VFGNNDGDKMNISRLMNEANSQVKFFGEADGKLELDCRKIAMTHYPFYANALARTGDYDLVCFGHDHKGRIETHGKCLAVNPGCLNPVRPDDTVGFAIYDTAAHKAELHAV
jgi:predicted phosphodiesterase